MTDLETKARALAEAVLNRHSGTDVVDAARALLAALDAEPSAPVPSDEAVARELGLDGDFWGRDPKWLRRLVRAVAAGRERARKEGT